MEGYTNQHDGDVEQDTGLSKRSCSIVSGGESRTDSVRNASGVLSAACSRALAGPFSFFSSACIRSASLGHLHLAVLTHVLGCV